MIYIMRGLPGSGKSSWASEIAGAQIFSADSYHMVNGVYRYDPKIAGQAHNECFKSFLLAAMSNRKNAFIVDNTNTSLVELSPYVRVCEAFERDYTIVYVMCSVASAIARNIHGVPPNTILTMNRNLLTEVVPAHWKQMII
jgi:predicted kinase